MSVLTSALWEKRADSCAHEVFDLGPIEPRRVNFQCDPPMLSDIGGTEETRIIQENSLQLLFNFHADSQFVFIFFEHGEHLALRSKCGMAKSRDFVDVSQYKANLAKPLQNLGFTQHLGNDTAYDRICNSKR